MSYLTFVLLYVSLSVIINLRSFSTTVIAWKQNGFKQPQGALKKLTDFGKEFHVFFLA